MKAEQDFILDALFEIEDFVGYSYEIQSRIIRTFINFEDDFIWNDDTLVIQCRKCLNARLVNSTLFGAIEHYFRHREDTLVKIGAIESKYPSKLSPTKLDPKTL